jgi:hypothetical protein
MRTVRDLVNSDVLRVGEVSDMFNTASCWPLIERGYAWDGHKYKGHDRIKVKIHAEHWDDHRRFWILFSVWLDDEPVCAGRSAGREGDDHYDRWIVDQPRYFELAGLINAMNPEPLEEDVNCRIVGMDEDLGEGDINSWYGRTLGPGKMTRLNEYGWQAEVER